MSLIISCATALTSLSQSANNITFLFSEWRIRLQLDGDVNSETLISRAILRSFFSYTEGTIATVMEYIVFSQRRFYDHHQKITLKMEDKWGSDFCVVFTFCALELK